MLKTFIYVSSTSLDERFDAIDRELAALSQAVKSIREGVQQMATELDSLTTQVKSNTDAEASAVLLINGIAARILAAGTDGPQLTALAASLKSSSDTLAAAVVANTPAA
jgi:hypothetical protein